MRIITLTVLLALFSLTAGAMDESEFFNAASVGDTGTVGRWLLGGGSPNVVDAGGNSALLLASENGFTDTAGVLIAGGAVVDLANSRGYTPLFYAIYNLHPDMIALLMESGADQNFANSFGTTPLHYVQAEGYSGIKQYIGHLRADKPAPKLGPNSLRHMKPWQKNYFSQLFSGNRDQADAALATGAKDDPYAKYLLAIELKDKERARSARLMWEAAEAGNVDAMYQEGLRMIDGVDPVNAAKGFIYLKSAAAAHHIGAAAQCGRCYLFGIGVRADYKKALSYITASVEKGDPDGLFYLGYMKLYGIGMQEDRSGGITDITTAATLGSDAARRQIRHFTTESALTYLKKYKELSRGQVKSYMLSMNALPLEADTVCDSYDVSALFDRDYGVHIVTLCYPYNGEPEMTFTLYSSTYPVFRERLLQYASSTPVEFITEEN